MKEVLDILNNLLEITGSTPKEVKSKLDDIHDELSKVDRKKTDIDHYIEDAHPDMYEAWMIFKRDQDILKERRQIKIRESICNAIYSRRNLLTEIKDLRDNINNIIQRNEVNPIYNPRELKDLNYGLKTSHTKPNA